MTQILYIVARTDLHSMNPGKLAAQVSHAASQLSHVVGMGNKYQQELYVKWASQARGFGTVLVLNGKHDDAFRSNFVQARADKNGTSVVDMVNDPTYPVRDGQYTHYVPLDTCWFALVDTADEKHADLIAVLKTMDLHK